MNQAQAQVQDAICIECQEGITNPICPECLAKEVRTWKPELKTMLVTPDTEEFDESGVRCIKCGGRVSICAHCYTNDIYDLIGEEFPEFADEFERKFGINEKFF